jgi:hypothetical protein
MKKIFTLIWVLSLIYACSKSNKEDTGKTVDPPVTTTTPAPHYVAPTEGSLKVNVTSLTLHVGESATIIAAKSDADGKAVNASGLTWNSSSTATATITTGLVTAKAVGLAEITVTDGVHGLISINVNVVDDATVIADKAAQADLKQSVIVVAPNGSATFDYTLYNARGKAVTGAVTFLPPTGSGITFAGNKVTASVKTGDFTVPIRSGADTLQNALRVLVQNPADTTYAITGVGSIVGIFYQYDVSSERPVLINVTKSWVANGVTKQYSFITSPDKMTFSDGNVNLDANGYLHSVNYTNKNYYGADIGFTNFGSTDVNLFYKTTHFHCPVSVSLNPSGSYGKKLNADEEYNICITLSGPKLRYDSWISPFKFNPYPTKLPINGTYYFKINGKTKVYNNSNTLSGTYMPVTWIASNSALELNFGNTITKSSLTFTDGNKSIFGDITKYQYLAKDAGNCVAPPVVDDPTTNTLAWFLYNGITSKVWKGNTCFNNNFDPTLYTFNKDGSGQEKELQTGGSTSAFSWTADADNVITMTTAANQVLKFYVTKFSDTSLEFSKITFYDSKATPANQTITSAQVGCTIGLVPQ